MIKRIGFLAIVAGLLLTMAVPALAARPDNPVHPNAQVYVISQGLTYDSIVLTDLPANGPFQQLFPTADGLMTQFGPGDPGYLGGRWWIDVNGDGEQNEGDMFFLCPLLGPGYEA